MDHTLISATFQSRPNRFVVEIAVAGCPTTASLPNPGRMQELLLPGAELLVRPGPEGGKHPWRVVATRSAGGGGAVIYLDTGGTNRVAAQLIAERRIPALADYDVVRAEVTVPGMRSRFDFLLRHRETAAELLLEVKSCTLFNGRWAMFPDAVTERGTRHLLELAEAAGAQTPYGGRGSPAAAVAPAAAAVAPAAAILFVVHSDEPEFFLPDYHSDLTFARTLLAVKDRVPILATGVRWGADLEVAAYRRELAIPWEILPPLLEDRGAYLVVLRLDRPTTIATGALGDVTYRRGYYLYIGSAQRNLTARLNRHRRPGRRRKHWHIDYLRETCTVVDSYTIREPWRRETEIVRRLRPLADEGIPRFGSSDSPEPSHLLYFTEDPRRRADFQDLLLELRRHGPEQSRRGLGVAS